MYLSFSLIQNSTDLLYFPSSLKCLANNADYILLYFYELISISNKYVLNGDATIILLLSFMNCNLLIGNFSRAIDLIN